jgi:putative phosphoribosyl transferase
MPVVPMYWHWHCRAAGIGLDILPVRKIGAPGWSEFALGAIAGSGSHRAQSRFNAVFDNASAEVQSIIQRETLELERRQAAYREGRVEADTQGKVLLLIDDGMATGSTMSAAVAAARSMNPARVVAVAPVAARAAVEALAEQADEVVVLYQPEPFRAVSLWYQDFKQVSDAEVIELLRKHADPGGK